MKKAYYILILFSTFFYFNFCAQSFTTILPKENTNISSIDPEFSWNEYLGATDYDFTLAEDPAFSTIIYQETLPQTNLTYSGTLLEGIYYWRVEAIHPQGNILTSTMSFEVFSPSDLNDLELWLDASTNVVLDGSDNVEQWLDESSNGYTFNQFNTSKRPSVNSNFLNGLPAVEFDGSNDVLDAGNVLNIGTNSRSMFVVGNQKSSSNGTFFAKSLFGSANGRYAVWFEGMDDFNVFYRQPANSSFNFITDSPSNLPSFMEVIIDRDNTKLFAQHNKTNSDYRSISSSYDMNTNFRFLLGAYNNSADDGEVWNLDGNIAEVIFLENADSSKIAKINNYIKCKYNPILNLGEDIREEYGLCNSVNLDATNNYKSYEWNTGESTSSISISSSGKYWVDVNDSLGFHWSDTIYVDFPEPDVPTQTIFCPDSSITWNPNLGPHYSYAWSTGETTEFIEIDEEDSYSVQITDTNGCVYNSPVVNFTEDTMQASISLGPDLELCSGNQIELVSTVPDIVAYDWSTGETTPSIVVNTTDEYILEVENSAGCLASDTVNVDIIGVAPDMEIGFPAIQCVGETYNYEDLSETLDGSTITSWDWDFGDGTQSTDETGTHGYGLAGTYQVTLEIDTDADCGNSITEQIEVMDNPVVDYLTMGTCEGEFIDFSGSQITPTIITSWEWDFDNPASGAANNASGQNVSHVFDEPGDYFVELTVEDVFGCVGSVNQLIDILPAPVPDFDFNEVCLGGVVSFENQATIQGSTITGQTWGFGDGTFSNQSEPNKVYSFHGDYDVTFTVNANNGCTKDSTRSLKIHAFPQNDILADTLCAGLVGGLEDNSFVPNGSVAQVFWDFGDGQEISGFSPNYTFSSPGEKEITHRVLSAFGCETIETFTVDVSDLLSADFQLTPNAFLADFPINFESTSSGADSLTWLLNGEFLNNETSFDFTFDLDSIDTEQTFTLIANNEEGCQDEVSFTNTVLERRTDLAITEVFVQEQGGFNVVGVRLENRGTTPIVQAELFLRTQNTPLIREVWQGELQAGESENYVFNAQTSTTVNQELETRNFICVEGHIISAFGFEDADLSNNERCIYAGEEQEAILFTPYPNPVDDDLYVRIVLPEADEISLYVYDNLGRKVQTIVENDPAQKGLNKYTTNTNQWAGGIYHIHLETSEENLSRKVFK